VRKLVLDEEDIYQLLDAKAQATELHLAASNRIPLIEAERLKGELRSMFRSVSRRVASDPHRLSEALHNLDHLLTETERQALMHGITRGSLSDALSRLCPIFPFC
jgi:type II secretory pathway component PulF